jgi:preprotein translocase subunit SecA
MVTKAIERAQKKVEMQNFAIRKHTLEYDDVMNVQRKWIYERRLAALERPSIRDEVVELIETVLDDIIEEHCPENVYQANWNWASISEDLRKIYLLNYQPEQEEIEKMSRELLKEKVLQAVTTFYERKEQAYGDEIMRQLERYAVLSTIDRHWRDHLAEIDELRAGISLRAYHGQMGKPIDIYKKEAFEMFEKMVREVDREAVSLVYKLQVNIPEQQQRERQREMAMATQHADTTNLAYAQAAAGAGAGPTGTGSGGGSPMAEASQAGSTARTVRREQPKVGRNDPCPCGSGKKYKKCHGAGQ